MYKVKNNIAPIPVQELFPEYENIHNLRNQRSWQTYKVRTSAYDTETLLYRGRKTWNMLPESIKLSKTLPEFRNKIKVWLPTGCECRLCRQCAKYWIHMIIF